MIYVDNKNQYDNTMTPEQREERLRKMRENQKKKRREYDKKRLQNETTEQREERLRKQREYEKKKKNLKLLKKEKNV